MYFDISFVGIGAGTSSKKEETIRTKVQSISKLAIVFNISKHLHLCWITLLENADL